MPNGNDEQRRSLTTAWGWLRKAYPQLDQQFGDKPWDEQGDLSPDAYNAYRQIRMGRGRGADWEEHEDPPIDPRMGMVEAPLLHGQDTPAFMPPRMAESLWERARTLPAYQPGGVAAPVPNIEDISKLFPHPVVGQGKRVAMPVAPVPVQAPVYPLAQGGINLPEQGPTRLDIAGGAIDRALGARAMGGASSAFKNVVALDELAKSYGLPTSAWYAEHAPWSPPGLVGRGLGKLGAVPVTPEQKAEFQLRRERTDLGQFLKTTAKTRFGGGGFTAAREEQPQILEMGAEDPWQMDLAGGLMWAAPVGGPAKAGVKAGARALGVGRKPVTWASEFGAFQGQTPLQASLGLPGRGRYAPFTGPVADLGQFKVDQPGILSRIKEGLTPAPVYAATDSGDVVDVAGYMRPFEPTKATDIWPSGRPATRIFDENALKLKEQADALAREGQHGEAQEYYRRLSVPARDHVERKLGEEGFGLGEGGVTVNVNFGTFAGVLEPSIVLDGVVPTGRVDAFTKLMVDIAEFDFGQSSVVLHQAVRETRSPLLGRVAGGARRVPGESIEPAITLKFTDRLQPEQINTLRTIYRAIDENSGFVVHADNQGIDILNLTAYNEDYPAFAERGIQFVKAVKDAGIRHTHTTSHRKVRHLGVSPGRVGGAGDGLGSYDDYRRHYGSVTSGYDPAKDILPTRIGTAYPITSPGHFGYAPERKRAAALMARQSEEYLATTKEYADPLGMGSADIESAIAHVPEKFRGMVTERFKRLVAGEDLKESELRYLHDKTGLGRSKIRAMGIEAKMRVSPNIGREIRAVREDTLAKAFVENVDQPKSTASFQENWNDRFWWIRGLRTGHGFLRRLAPPTEEAIERRGAGWERGGEYDIDTALTIYSGVGPSGYFQADFAIRDAQKRADILTERGIFVDTMNEYVAAKHAQSVFKSKKDREFVGLLTKGDADTSLNQIRIELNKLDAEAGRAIGTAADQAEAAAQSIVEHYQRTAEAFAKKGFITRKEATELAEKYPYYHPIEYTNDLAAHAASDIHAGDFGLVTSVIRSLSEKGRYALAKTPLDTIHGSAIKSQEIMARNDVVRTVIRLTEHNQKVDELGNLLPGGFIKEADRVEKISPMKLVATTSEDVRDASVAKIFMPHSDPPGTVSFFDPNTPGKRQFYKVPKVIVREINFLHETYRADDWLAAFNGFQKATIVTYNPIFVIRNIFNDMLVAWLGKGVMPQKAAAEIKTALAKLEDDPAMQLFTLPGIRQQRAYGKSMDEVMAAAGMSIPARKERALSLWRKVPGVKGEDEKAYRAAILETGGDPRSAGYIAGKIKDATIAQIPRLGEAGELAPRLATAKKYLNRKLGKGWEQELRAMHRDYDAGKISGNEYMTYMLEFSQQPAVRAAVADAVQSTIDFQRGGRNILWLNQYLLFLNPAMEGAKVPLRALRRDPKGAGARLTSMILGHMALAYYNTKQEGYFGIPRSERYGSIVVMAPDFLGLTRTDGMGNKIPIRWNLVPMTREYSLFFAPFTYFVEKMAAENPESFGTFMKGLLADVAPHVAAHSLPLGMRDEAPYAIAPLPGLLEMALEATANFDFYRQKPIIPEELKYDPAAEQVFPWTSPFLKELAEGVARIGGPETSPILWEFLWNSATGGVGKEILRGLDLVTRRVSPPSEAEEALAEELRGSADVKLPRTPSLVRREVAQRASEEGLDPQDITALAKGPPGRGWDLPTPSEIPVVGGFLKSFTGAPYPSSEIFSTAMEEAGGALGIDPEQTQAASRKMKEISSQAFKKQQKADDAVNILGIMGSTRPEHLTTIENWILKKNDISDAAWEQRQAVAFDLPGAAQFASDEDKNAFYAKLTAILEEYGDDRDPGEVLLSGYYAISDTTEGGLSEAQKALGMTNLGLKFERIKEYKESLSISNRHLLEALLLAGKTDAVQQYDRDMAVIEETGFWDITSVVMEEYRVAEAYEKYIWMGSRERDRYLANNRMLERAIAEVGSRKDRMREASVNHEVNPDLERLLIKWTIYDTPIREKIGVAEQMRPGGTSGGLPVETMRGMGRMLRY